MIQVRTLFSGWVAVDEEKARNFANTIMNGMRCGNEEARIAHVNSRLKGIQIINNQLEVTK